MDTLLLCASHSPLLYCYAKEPTDFKELQKTNFYVPEPKGGYTQGFVNFLRNPKEECTPRSVYINS